MAEREELKAFGSLRETVALIASQGAILVPEEVVVMRPLPHLAHGSEEFKVAWLAAMASKVTAARRCSKIGVLDDDGVGGPRELWSLLAQTLASALQLRQRGVWVGLGLWWCLRGHLMAVTHWYRP
jgi:hypothetical protein